jgi:hypothetical protein
LVRIIFITIFLITSGKEASASFSVPDHMLGVKKIMKDFRKPIQDKLLQMRQNFIERSYKNGTRFISNEKVVCPFGVEIAPKESIVTYTYTTDVTKDEVTNKITTVQNRLLRGCAKKDTIQERIKIVGNKAYLQDHQDVMQGKLQLQMGKGAKELVDYRMLDSQGVQVMRIYSKISDTKRITNFYFGDQKFIQITYIKNKTNLDLRYRFYNMDFNINRNGFVYSEAIPARTDNFFRAIVHDNGAIEYFNDKGIQVSLASFQKNFQLNGISWIMDSILIELPVTDFVSTGGDSARLKEELRNAQTWLIGGNPAQLNLVRNLIEEYLQAVDKGLLIDKRPNRQ